MYTLIGFVIGATFAVHDRRLARAMLPWAFLGLLALMFVEMVSRAVELVR